MTRLLIAILILTAAYRAEAGVWTVRIQHLTFPLSRPVCDPKGWPNPTDRATPAETIELAHNRLYRLQVCGFIDAATFNSERARLKATVFKPVCTKNESAFGNQEVKVFVSYWGRECER